MPRLEEFVNLKGLFIQSSNLFGISSVQFSSLGTSLSGKIVQFGSGCWGQVPLFISVQFILLSSQTPPVLTLIDLADFKVQTGLASVQYSSVAQTPVCLESSFSSVWGTGAKCPYSVCSVQFIQFSSQTLLDLIYPPPPPLAWARFKLHYYAIGGVHREAHELPTAKSLSMSDWHVDVAW